MKIRPALLSDATVLNRIENEIFSHENFPLSYGSFCYHIRNNLLFVVEIEEKIVAYILVLVKRKNAKLYSLGVLPAFRGRKISNALMKRALEQLFFLKFKKVTLEVRADNQNAISLYENIGFAQTKRVKNFYLDGCDAYVMELVIP